MEFWQAIAFTEPDQLADFARSAEAVGFDGVTTGDHLVTPASIGSTYPYTADGRFWIDPDMSTPDPLVLAGALAQVTERLRFMVTAYVLPMRDPFSAAKAISTAAVLSGDRLVLGVGVGWMEEEFRRTGQSFRNRGRRTDEMLAVLAKLFAGGMVEHHGEFYDFEPCQLAPVPRRRVPILIAGDSDPALRRATRFDGWLGAHYDVDAIPPLVERFQKARAAAGATGPAQVVVAVNDLREPDQLRRLRDVGVTAVIHMPLAYDGPRASALEAKRRAMESFAEQVIGR